MNNEELISHQSRGERVWRSVNSLCKDFWVRMLHAGGAQEQRREASDSILYPRRPLLLRLEGHNSQQNLNMPLEAKNKTKTCSSTRKKERSMLNYFFLVIRQLNKIQRSSKWFFFIYLMFSLAFCPQLIFQ